MRFVSGRERNTQGVTWPCEIINSPLAVPKCNLGEVEKAMFPWVDWPCEFIFYLLSRPKCDLDEIEKSVSQSVTWP
jgi:hypothetical protein